MSVNKNIAHSRSFPSFFIFGLSGVGKTTFIEKVCEDTAFYLPRQLVTRAPRADDNKHKFEYVTRKAFQQIKLTDLLIYYDDGIHYYGYRKSALKTSSIMLLYGLPAKWEATKRMGGVLVLIRGNASTGLQMRKDPIELRERREKVNESLHAQYYGNPVFQEQMDLILTNKFGHIEKIVDLFKRYALLKKAEVLAFQRSLKSLLFVLKMYHHPIEGMSYKQSQHYFWVQKAFKSEVLSRLFYSKVINDSRNFLKTDISNSTDPVPLKTDSSCCFGILETVNSVKFQCV